MDRSISAGEANQRFSEMLRNVAEGDSFTVTSRGRPVARVVPVDDADRKSAFDRMMSFLDTQPTRQVKPWTREDLYD